MEPEKKCLVLKCNEFVKTRGLCNACYSTARAMMSKGITTEEELIRKGLLLSVKRKESLFKEQFNLM